MNKLDCGCTFEEGKYKACLRHEKHPLYIDEDELNEFLEIPVEEKPLWTEN